jgi:hypothetical protein
MSRVERTENPSQRQAERGRSSNAPRREEPRPTPDKAEGELKDVEQALERQKE